MAKREGKDERKNNAERIRGKVKEDNPCIT